MVRLLVGPSRREFLIHKKLLCASSSFFRYSLESLSDPSSPTSPIAPTSPISISSDASTNSASSCAPSEKLLWLSEEAPEVMELFVHWLYQRNAFRGLLEQMVAAVSIQPAPQSADHARVLKARRALHWNLIKLHLFAAIIRLPMLQDAAMDAVQDLYLRCDMDVSMGFLRFLYDECSREQAFRLRKWAVAMLAWTLSNGGADPIALNELFDEFPALYDDYAKHMEKMEDSRADVRVKNPQLRLPRNKLKNEERHFGFRQCSFHSHRSLVGEGRCPYAADVQSQHASLSAASEASRKAAAAAAATVVDENEVAPSPPVQAQVKPSVSKAATRHRQHTRLQSQSSHIWTVHESAEET